MEVMDELLSTAEAADACGVVPATITRWVDSGKLVPVHKGKGLRGAFVFRKSDVEKLKDTETAPAE